MIELDSITYAYGHGQPVFRNFAWCVEKGEAWAVLGPSGCGKTTLLYLLAGLVFPILGRLLVDGLPLIRPRPQTGLILQDYGLLPWATVRQNIELGLRVRKFYGPDGRHAPSETMIPVDVDRWLDRLGLEGLQNKYPGKISGGQRQRTAVARTLALNPDLLLMDEPFSSLDAPTRQDLQELMLELWTEHRLTMVIVTHAIEEAAILGQKILVLGQPPNTKPRVIDNLASTEPGFRESGTYLAVCRKLRGLMEGL